MNDTNRYSVAHTAPAFGAKVRAFGVNDLAYEGKVCTVTQAGLATAWGEFTSIAKPDDTISLSFDSYERVEDEPTVDIAMIPVADHDRTVESLNAQIESLTRDRDNLRTRAAAYAEDFNTVGTMLMEEAERRGWCSEYDEFVDAVNGRTQRLELPSREREVEISWEETYTVTVRRTGTATLRADYGDDDIERAARDLNGNSDASREEVLQAVRDGEYESCEFVDGTAEEA